MQKLHLVGFTADFDGLIFSARKGAKTGSFVVPIDGRLLKQLAEAERHRDGTAVRGPAHAGSPRLERPESSLTPREMQDRIRSGWSLDEVAAEAGVDLDWVSRFAAPVLAEVRQVLEQARAAVYDKPRFGLSALPLGASVRRNVIERGVRMVDDELDECWSAYQLDDETWVVRFVYSSRGREQEAEWYWHPDGEELVSRNRLGAQLGYAIRGRARNARPPDVKRTPTPPATVKRRAPAPRAATSTASARPESKRTTAKKSAPARTTSRARVSGTRKKAASATSKKPAKKRAGQAADAERTDPPRQPPAVHAAVPQPARVISLLEVPPAPARRSDAALARTFAEPRAGMPIAVPGPLPSPGPAPVPDEVRQAVTTPIGDDLEPPVPGPVDFDEESGVARIDSRRLSRYVSGPVDSMPSSTPPPPPPRPSAAPASRSSAPASRSSAPAAPAAPASRSAAVCSHPAAPAPGGVPRRPRAGRLAATRPGPSGRRHPAAEVGAGRAPRTAPPPRAAPRSLSATMGRAPAHRRRAAGHRLRGRPDRPRRDHGRSLHVDAG